MARRHTSQFIANFVYDTPSGFVRVLPDETARPARLLRLGSAIAVLAALVVTAYAVSGENARASTLPQTLVTEEGVTITVHVDTVTPQQMYDWLKQSGLQARIGLERVDVVDTGFDSAAVSGYCNDSGCASQPGAIQLTDDSLQSHWAFTTGHEYGHVWENHYRWTYWDGSYDAYLKARGLLGDPLVGSKTCLKPAEMIATDYWRLFGAPETQVFVARCHADLPWAEDVPGLRDFLAIEWTHGNPPPGYSGSGSNSTATPTATPAEATPTPTPTATPEPEPTATPTEESSSGGDEVVVTMEFGRGWHEFTAPISGRTNEEVYMSRGRNDGTTHVDRGNGYRVKGPLRLEITGQ